MEGASVQIRQFLAKSFRNHELRDDEDIFALGFVNSLLALQLVSFVEQQFAIQIQDEDLDLDNFRTIAAIERLVDRRRAAA